MVATHHRSAKARDAPLLLPGVCARLFADQLDRRDRLGLALHGPSADLAESKATRGTGGTLGDEDLTRLSALLESGRGVHGIAGDHADLGPRVQRGDDLPGVDADPHREAEAVSALELVVQALEAPPHTKRGAQRPRRVVLVCGGDSEGCHDRIADELLDCSTLGLDLGAHRVGVRAEHVLQVLGIELLPERRRSRDVREEHGDELALCLACRALFERAAAMRAESGAIEILAGTRATDSHFQGECTSLQQGTRERHHGSRVP